MAALNATDLRERVDGELARRSLRAFTRQAWHVVEPATPLIWNWHIDAICDHLEAVTRGEIRNLVINMPPRCMKSTTVSVMWPMWVWTFNPAFRWMFASYAMSLAIRDSLKCRRLVESPWYQRHFSDVFQLADDQNAKSRFENDKSGYRFSSSVDSAVTGEGGNAVVCDDPHNVRQAESMAEREAVLEWWDGSISSRLNDPKRDAKVIVMQRVHANDLTGHVIEQGGYSHLYLPMEYEPGRHCTTVLGWQDPRHSEGELLWEQRIGPTEVAGLKVSLGSYNYAGQYQQRPAPREGGVFKREWFNRRYRREALPRLKQIVQAVDSAFKTGVSSDYSVIATWGTDGRDYYLLGLWRAKVAFPELVRAVKDQAAIYRPQVILIEDAASGQSAIQQLRRDTNLPIVAVPAKGSKESRADGVSPVFEAGKVVLPEGAAYLGDFIEEHVNFPRAAHDDIVDTSSMALARLKGSSNRIAIAAARPEMMDPAARQMALTAEGIFDADGAADETGDLNSLFEPDATEGEDEDVEETATAPLPIASDTPARRRELDRQRQEQQERQAQQERVQARQQQMAALMQQLQRLGGGNFGGFGG